MSAVGFLRRKLQLLQPRTGVRSRPLSSALALCRIPPANNAISSTALKLCVHSLNKIIPFLYHKRGDKNNYGMWKRCHITVFVIVLHGPQESWTLLVAVGEVLAIADNESEYAWEGGICS